MHLSHQDLIDLIHDAVDFFRREFLREAGESFHVTEKDSDLFAFPLDLVPLG